MRFGEAEQRYRELEEKLTQGELTEGDFLDRVAQLQITDESGRRWMMSGRTGRWLMHDGQGWVRAEPPIEMPESEAGPKTRGESVPYRQGGIPAAIARVPWSPSLRWLVTGLVAILLIGCLTGLAVSGWVLFLRNSGESKPLPPDTAVVGLVQTYTARPATATYTPTSTPTPSRTSTATATRIPTSTPVPTETPVPATPTPLPPPTSSPTPTATQTGTPTATSTSRPKVTYVVQKGDTLFEIALRFGVSLQALAAANGITDPALIRPGQELVIPEPGTTPSAPTITATWTPIALSTRRTTPSPVATKAGATPKPTARPTAKPTAKATVKATSTPKPAALTGKIAFTVWNSHLGEGKYELFVSQIDGSGRNRLGIGYRQPQFRQDGKFLAANGDRNQSYEHLDMMNPNGGELREISQYSEDAYPTWSPDGALVAYSTTAWPDGRVRLGIVYDIYGKQWRWIPYGGSQILGEYPFWMPDGRIVYHGCDFWSGGVECGLYVTGPDGGAPQRLTTDRSDTAPAGRRDRVAFMSGRDGNWEVYVVNMDGSGLKRLTKNSAEDGLPTWAPDGKSIAFVSKRGGVWAIWVMNADGSNQRKLFDLGGGYGSGVYDWTTERISWAP